MAALSLKPLHSKPSQQSSHASTQPSSKQSSKTHFASIVSSAYSVSTPASAYASNFDPTFDGIRERPPVEKSYWRDPKRWTPRCWFWTVLFNIGCVAGMVVIVYYVVKSRLYPDYGRIVRYVPGDVYEGEKFWGKMDYFYDYDPAQGFVHYANPVDAQNLNLTYATDSTAILRVDNRDIDSSTGRLSARLTTKSTYNTGLFVFDIRHAPFGCATWPALWLTDPYHWPEHGEIDILEGSNLISGSQTTLHTTKDCSMDVRRKQTGNELNKDCYNSTSSNAGCGVKGPDNTFGNTFNSKGGGIYALEIRAEGIRVWFFARGNNTIPHDLYDATLNHDPSSPTRQSPNPTKWPPSLADFPATECDIGAHFRNMSIVVNIDICGQLAGQDKLFRVESGCPGKCDDFVKGEEGSKGETWKEAYWEFGKWWVFDAL